MNMEKHPIQVKYIGVKELSLIAHVPPYAHVDVPDTNFTISIAHSAYDEVEKEIVVGVKIEVGLADGKPKEDYPYSMKIELVAFFSVQDDKFKAEHLDSWASSNAPYLLLPFIREQAYSLTTRAGFAAFILPLYKVDPSK